MTDTPELPKLPESFPDVLRDGWILYTGGQMKAYARAAIAAAGASQATPELPKLPDPEWPMVFIHCEGWNDWRLESLSSMEKDGNAIRLAFSADQMNTHYLAGYEAGMASRAEPQSGYYLWDHPKHPSRVARPEDADFAKGEPLWVRCYPVEVFDAVPGEPVAKVHYCAEKRKPGGCQLHNLHCGYPKCDQAPAPAAVVGEPVIKSVFGFPDAPSSRLATPAVVGEPVASNTGPRPAPTDMNILYEIGRLAKASAQGRAAYGLCPAGCGCVWRDNLDGSMSLGINQRSCTVCEPLAFTVLIPLFAGSETAEHWMLKAHEFQAERDALATPAEGLEPVFYLDEEMAGLLRQTIGDDGEPNAIKLHIGDGHSGHGLYVSLSDYPEEGAIQLVESPAVTAVDDSPVPLMQSLQEWKDVEVIARISRAAGKTLKEVRNPSVTARDSIVIANYIAELQGVIVKLMEAAPIAPAAPAEPIRAPMTRIAGVNADVLTRAALANPVPPLSPAEPSEKASGIEDEIALTRAVSVMNDVLTDISGWEDRALAEAVESSKVDLCAMIECIRMRSDGSYVPGSKAIDGEAAPIIPDRAGVASLEASEGMVLVPRETLSRWRKWCLGYEWPKGQDWYSNSVHLAIADEIRTKYESAGEAQS